jgi:hypothetical protein
MTKPRKGELALHCIMCGKDFRAGDKPECGAMVNGKAWCKPERIRREMDERFSADKPANAELSGRPDRDGRA